MTLTKDDYQGALKKMPKGPKESYLLVTLRYDRQFVLPYKQGIALMEALESAMMYESAYSSPPKYQPIGDEVSITPMSEETINDIKVAKLLNISQDTAKLIRESA